MKKTNEFIMDTMVNNPNHKIYWNGCKFIMEVRTGDKLHFGKNINFSIAKDDAANAIYYTNENNQQVYMLYLEYVD